MPTPEQRLADFVTTLRAEHVPPEAQRIVRLGVRAQREPQRRVGRGGQLRGDPRGGLHEHPSGSDFRDSNVHRELRRGGGRTGHEREDVGTVVRGDVARIREGERHEANLRTILIAQQRPHT